jgi:riboflavin kinase/FMN adenylyltransferase
MNAIDWNEFINPHGQGNWAVSIGVFDGVHVGHRKLIRNVLSFEPDLTSAIITFRENPKKILRPQSFKGSISGLDEKVETLRDMGIHTCVLIDFSLDFGTLSGASFVSFLAKTGTRHISIGPNFRCGNKMDTNAQSLLEIGKAFGIDVTVVSPVLYAGHPVSSSRIRSAILEGALEDAMAMLGRHHTVALSDIRRESRGFAADVEGSVVLPPDGVYEVMAKAVSGNRSFTATICGRSIRTDEDFFNVRSLELIHAISRV